MRARPFCSSRVPPLFTTTEAADYLQVCLTQVQRWARSGRLKSFRAGRFYRFDERQLKEFLGAPENAPLFTPSAPLNRLSDALQGAMDEYGRTLNRPSDGEKLTPQAARRAAEDLARALSGRRPH